MFKYHMMLREGVCSNSQSTGEGFWPNCHITFIVFKKLVETGLGGGEGLAENVRIPLYRG